MNAVTKKIVAIGGGECGRTAANGEKLPYETAGIDKEIIRLSGKQRPRVLLLAHAQILNGAESEKKYYETMERIYKGIYGCECLFLAARELEEAPEKAKEYVDSADVIYEGGGDTPAMIGLWRKTGFDSMLKQAWESGKVMCGLSAGAICWFALGNTDSPGYREREVNKIPALGFINAYFSPHCQLEWKRASEISSLRRINKVGLSVSNCAAIEIVGEEYRVITSTPADSSFKPYALRTCLHNGRLYETALPANAPFRPLGDLLALGSYDCNFKETDV